MKEEKGIALITLIIILVVLGLIIFTGLKYAENYMKKQEIEDIKANMLAIQSVITHINNKKTVDKENNALVGTKLDLESNQTTYIINEELKTTLLEKEETELYILNEEELKNNGIKNVKVNETEFYIVDYNSGEVFYSLGVEGKYKLSEI